MYYTRKENQNKKKSEREQCSWTIVLYEIKNKANE